MRTFRMCTWMGLLLLGTLPMLGGCETDSSEEFGYVEYSPLSIELRSEVREAHRLFTDHPSSPVNVLQVFDVIEQEVLRLYPYEALMGDFGLNNGALALTETLPKDDNWGDFTPDGGYLQFVELITEDGDDTTVYKRHREFTAGAITNFDYGKRDETVSSLETVQQALSRVTIAADTVYEETAWHQAYGGQFDGVPGAVIPPTVPDYTYQSHPKLQITYLVGSTHSKSERVTEKIQDEKGWEAAGEQAVNTQVSGLVTLFQPSMEGLDKNEDEEDATTSDSVSKNVLELRSRFTTVVEQTNAIGAEGAIEEIVVITTTVDETIQSDAGTGAPFSVERETHETKDVRYRLAFGKGLNEIAYRERDWREDYHDTTLLIEKESYTYETDSPSLQGCGNDDDCPFGYECREGFGGTNRCLPPFGLGSCNPNQVSYGLSVDGDEVCQNPVTLDGSTERWTGTTNPVTRNDIEQ